jgi:hypothetical protein
MPRLEPEPPAIIWGAAALAMLSLIWSGYAITDLMHSGPFGLSVAVAGDLGWITVLWAEYRGVTIAGRAWAAPLAGWAIAIGVAALLVLHGAEHSRGQAVAGPFVVLVGKVVWTFALAAMKDPTALTPEQETEINSVIRDGGYRARLHRAESDAEIARIRAEARTTMARDEADFQIVMERLNKRAEIDRRTPLALTASSPAGERTPRPEQPNTIGGPEPEQPNITANTTPSNPNTVRDQIANNAATSTNSDREPASIAELVREHVANTPNNIEAIRAVMAARPDANKESVGAAVRRERRKQGPYL